MLTRINEEAEHTRRAFLRQRRTTSRLLSEDPLHNRAIHIREPVVAAGVAVGEARVVEAEEVEDGRVEIVDMHAVADDRVPEVVRLAVRVAAAHSAAGHPARERLRVVLAAFRVLRGVEGRGVPAKLRLAIRAAVRHD